MKNPELIAAEIDLPCPVSLHKMQKLIAFDRISDPGNLGTIIRTADWFGITQIVLSDDTASWYNPKVIQSTMGSCFRVNMYTMSLEALLQKNANAKYCNTEP